ncbi:MAG: hypothetical protein JWR02_2073 [Mucilaginibacter sp.]|nr:hypothetical protein [Mucilaginibacter sp.]
MHDETGRNSNLRSGTKHSCRNVKKAFSFLLTTRPYGLLIWSSFHRDVWLVEKSIPYEHPVKTQDLNCIHGTHYLTINATGYCLKVIFDKPLIHIPFYDTEKSYLPGTKGKSFGETGHTFTGHYNT